MNRGRSRAKIVFALTALAASLLATPTWAAWSHPAVAGHTTGVAPPVVTPGTTTPISGSATSGALSATATATSTGAVTTTTSSITHANGSVVTTTQSVTNYGGATGINVSGVVALTPGFTYNYVFNFPNLSAPAQSQTFANGLLVVTALPSASANSVAVAYTLSPNADIGAIPTGQVVVPLTPPPPTTTTAAGGTSPEIPPPTPVVPSRGPFQVPDVVALVQAASDEADQAIELCAVNTPPCIADALEAYADKLEALAPRLPPRLRTLPSIVRNAARRVRVAKTRAEAVGAVKTAIAQVHKAIALLKAEDPNAAGVGVQVGRDVDATLKVAEIKLLRSSGL